MSQDFYARANTNEIRVQFLRYIQTANTKWSLQKHVNQYSANHFVKRVKEN